MPGSTHARLTFEQRVWDVVRQVPHGRVITYGRVARFLGTPHLARTVGYAMARCPDDVPWHRVINSQGKISPRRSLESVVLQRHLLEQEGIVFDEDEAVDLQRYGFQRREHERARKAERRRQKSGRSPSDAGR